MDASIPLRDHAILVLPFTGHHLANPSGLTRVIRSVLPRAATRSFTVVFTTPPSASAFHAGSSSQPASAFSSTRNKQAADELEHSQLYSLLRKSPQSSFATFQLFLCRIYSALVAAQMGAGRILMDVEVHFDGEPGSGDEDGSEDEAWAEKLFRPMSSSTLLEDRDEVKAKDGEGAAQQSKRARSTNVIILENVSLPSRLSSILSDLPTYILPSSTLSSQGSAQRQSQTTGIQLSTPSQMQIQAQAQSSSSSASHWASYESLSSSSTLDYAPKPGPKVVAVGGTFDHLHAAHKLLLHLSFFLAEERLIVGIMADALLASKSNAALVEPLGVRLKNVESFLKRLGGSVSKDGEGNGKWERQSPSRSSEGDVEARRTGGKVIIAAAEINDALGPTAYDANIHALVVSRETVSGGKVVNKVRGENGLSELGLFVVDVIPNPPSSPSPSPTPVTSTSTVSGGTGASRTDKLDEPQAQLDGTRVIQERGEAVVDADEDKDEDEDDQGLDQVHDESILKVRKMGSTGVRQWIFEQWEKEKEKANQAEERML